MPCIVTRPLEIRTPDPTGIGQRLTLQQSSSLATGSWADSALPLIVGDGSEKTFLVPDASTGRPFFRIVTQWQRPHGGKPAEMGQTAESP